MALVAAAAGAAVIALRGPNATATSMLSAISMKIMVNSVADVVKTSIR